VIGAFVLAVLAFTTDSSRLCVADVTTGAPLTGVQIVSRDSATNAAHSGMMVSSCVRLRSGRIRLRRVGYRARDVVLQPSADVFVQLEPLSYRGKSGATVLASQRVVASRVEAAVARSARSIRVDDARVAGVSSTNELVASLPFTSLRSAHGETGLSLRGARREQVAITLDGMPLNDPATGIADVSDVPLSSLGSATVVLGADPIGAGSGAGGGVLALQSAPARLFALRAGAFGQRTAEGAWFVQGSNALWHASVSHARADNDFTFVNNAGASGVSDRERRVNNDERHDAVSIGVAGGAAQLALLASTSERGMVGAENVRTYDADRAHTTRILLRGQLSSDKVQFIAGARAFFLDYRDPTRPVLDSRARAAAQDAEVRGRVGLLAWRVGAGADQASATGGIAQTRGRAFVTTSYAAQSSIGAIDVGARLDAIGAFGALPSFSIAAEHEVVGAPGARSTWTVASRFAQAVRVPTLYDLYFSSPQRLFVRTLRPERVNVDAELSTRYELRTTKGALSAQGGLVARDTRDAIIWFPGNFGWSPANVGVERLRGAEARLQWRAHAVDASAWFTFYDAELTSGALRIPSPYVPRVAGGASFRADLHAYSLTLGARGMGRRPFSAGPRDPAFELPSVMLCDVALARRIPLTALLRATEALVSVSLDNAMDTAWQSVRGYPSPGRSWAITTTMRYHPQP